MTGPGIAAIEDVLARLVLDRSATAPTVPGDDAVASTVRALAHFWVGDFSACLEAAGRAEARAHTPLEQVLAAAALGLAEAGEPQAAGRTPWETALGLAADHADDGRDWSFARYLLAEAALDGARIDVAARVAAGSCWSAAWSGHPFEVMMLATQTRTDAFSGRIDAALASFGRLEAASAAHRLESLARAVRILLTGNADRTAETQELIDALVAEQVRPVDYLGRGTWVLAAFGAISIGDVPQSATLLLATGDDADLTHLTIIDRAIGLELLAHAALVGDDTEAALAWLEASRTIAEHPIALPACARLRSRVALHLGDAAEAVAQAERAVTAARADGRGIEAAEGSILLARAQIAADQVAEASRVLREEVAHSDEAGHLAVRRSAAQVLAVARRRLPPRNAGGWSVLSPREREVAERVLAGEETRDIARALFLSPATVRTHLSRVLCAFGVSSRIGLLALVGPQGSAARPERDLTPRQGEVVALLAQGHDNAGIATALGVSVKGVEKHVSDALRRWEVSTRFELARLWLAAPDPGTRADSLA